MKKKIISFSGGKDSSAMLLRMLELDYKIDEIVFADTELEFPEMYQYITKIENYIGRGITILKPKKSFYELFFRKITRGKYKGRIRGWPLVVFGCWWQRESKGKPLDYHTEGCINYIGYASDEKERSVKKISSYGKDISYKFPLIEWGWTEKDCLNYLKDRQLFPPIYKKFNRTGCWLCPKQSKRSLYKLWKYYPDLWKKLLKLDQIAKELNAPNSFGLNISLEELEESFQERERQITLL